jgi:hypothetical protein
MQGEKWYIIQKATIKRAKNKHKVLTYSGVQRAVLFYVIQWATTRQHFRLPCCPVFILVAFVAF